MAVNSFPHKVPGYAALTISLKGIGDAPGDATSDQMRAVADLAERYSFDEIRVTHHQNLVLPNVRQTDLFDVWQGLVKAGLATANVGLITDIISCPGLDYCALATARSIPIAQSIAKKFADQQRQRDIGELNIKISGCINACGHHHVGHIGILGLEKRGEESYQITLGGDATETAAIGEILGPASRPKRCRTAIERIVGVYLAEREEGESFIEAVRRWASRRSRPRSLLLRRPPMPLLDRTGLIADAYHEGSTSHRLVPFEALEAALAEAGNASIGVTIANTVKADALRPYFNRLSLIAIAFPAFTDGRGFSIGKQLRNRGFRGRLRAVGPLIPDQFAYALSLGFDEVEAPEAILARAPAAIWQAAAASISSSYQRGHAGSMSILDQRRKAREAARA